MNDLPLTESIWCKIDFCGLKYVIGAVYKPPDSPLSIMESVYDYVATNIANKSNFIVAGDFNLPNIDWDTLEAGTTEVKHAQLLLDMVFNINMAQVVKEYTRRENAGSS